jgi:hypothetical protein
VAGDVGREHGDDERVDEPLPHHLSEWELAGRPNGHRADRAGFHLFDEGGRFHLLGRVAVWKTVFARLDVQSAKRFHDGILAGDARHVGRVPAGHHVNDHERDEHEHRRHEDRHPQRGQFNHVYLEGLAWRGVWNSGSVGIIL